MNYIALRYENKKEQEAALRENINLQDLLDEKEETIKKP